MKPTPLKVNGLVGGLFPGSGALWVERGHLEGDGVGLAWVDIDHGYRLVSKAVPSTCKLGDDGHSVVYGGRLWFTCIAFGVYVFRPAKSQPVQSIRLRGVDALLPTSRGLWAGDRTSVRAIGGPEKGAVVALPRGFLVSGDYASNDGWAIAGSTVWAIGRRNGGQATLVRVDLARHRSTAYRIVVPRGFLSYPFTGGIAVVGGEVLLGDEVAPRLLRYSEAHPIKPLGYIELPGRGYSKHGLQVQGGVGGAWVEIEHRGGIRLFHISSR